MDLVTGATGFIGGILARKLLEQGKKVRCLVRSLEKARPLAEAGAELVQGDLARPEAAFRALAGVDRVFHLAGVTKALRKQDYWRGNVEASLNLARAFSLQGRGRFLALSSLAAAGPSRPGVPRTEEDEPAPVSLYGTSKLAGERAVTSLPEPHSWTILRPPIVYGPGDRDFFLVFKAARRKRVPLALPDQVCSLVHVEDLVRAVLLAAEDPAAHRKVYFVSSPPDLSGREMVELAGRVQGRSPRIQPVPAWAAALTCRLAWLWAWIRGRPGILSPDKAREMVQPGWACDSSRIREELGWSPALTHEEGFRRTLAWYRKEGWLKEGRGGAKPDPKPKR